MRPGCSRHDGGEHRRSARVRLAPMSEPVGVDLDANVATVEIRRGPNNYFDLDVLTRLADVLDELASDDAARAVVLCSEGKHFCAGADFSGSSGAVARPGQPHLYDMAIRLFEQPLPIVAAVQGAAIGGGLGLALAADFRVAAPSRGSRPTSPVSASTRASGCRSPCRSSSGTRPRSTCSTPGDGSTARRRTASALCDHLAHRRRAPGRRPSLAGEIATSAPAGDVRSIRQTLRGPLVEQVRSRHGARAGRAGAAPAHR